MRLIEISKVTYNISIIGSMELTIIVGYKHMSYTKRTSLKPINTKVLSIRAS